MFAGKADLMTLMLRSLLIMLPYLLALVAVAGLIGRQTAPPALTQPFRR